MVPAPRRLPRRYRSKRPARDEALAGDDLACRARGLSSAAGLRHRRRPSRRPCTPAAVRAPGARRRPNSGCRSGGFLNAHDPHDLTAFVRPRIIEPMLSWRSRARLIAVVLAMTLLAGGSMGAVCSGWTASAMARMSCCQGEGHDGTQAAADSCCAIGEQQRGNAGPALAFHAPAPVPVIVSFPPLAIPAAQWIVHRTHWATDVPIESPPVTHVLLSVFLI
jgi:hypothetical protein